MSMLEDVFPQENNKLVLKNKTALVTGASAGIGLVTSAWLAREGVNLILVARRKEKLEALKAELSVKFPTINVKIIAIDVTQKDVVRELERQNAFDVDIFINNAGLALERNAVIDLVEHDIDTMIQTNITAAFKLASAAAKKMVHQGSGHIVNLGSIAGYHAYEGGSVYCATKFAVRAFTQSLRQEMYDKNVRVSLVSPGIVKTEFSMVRFKGDAMRAEQVYEGIECLQPSDIARVILNALKEPWHVNLDEIVILPTVQAPVSNKVKKWIK